MRFSAIASKEDTYAGDAIERTIACNEMNFYSIVSATEGNRMKSAVRVDRVAKEYDGTNAQKGPGFAAGREEMLGFLGLDGTEKTALMSIITGIMPPGDGKGDVKDYGTTRRCLETSREEA